MTEEKEEAIDEEVETPPTDEKKEVEEEVDEDKEVDEEDDSDIEIPVRKTAKDFIIARQKRTIDKLRNKADEDETVIVGEDDEDEDDALTPESKSSVKRMIDAELAPVVKALASKADDDDLQELVQSQPEAKKYEKRIRAYMTHEQYRGVPPAVIFHHLAFQEAEKTGADRRKAADLEAAQSRSGGASRRPAKKNSEVTAEDINNMTDAEFEAFERKQRGG